MLTRLFADNYKCFSNFELRLGREHLFLGANGTGKTTVFDIIWALRSFVLGESKTLSLFPESSRTRWDRRSRQTFELDIQHGGHDFTYRLEVDRDAGDPRAAVHRELLDADGERALEAIKGEATFHGPSGPSARGFVSWSGSSLALAPGERFEAITAFLNAMHAIWLIRPDPKLMSSRSEAEEEFLCPDLSNFSSWYRAAIQERSELGEELRKSLREVWGKEFVAIRSVPTGEGVRILKTEWDPALPDSERPLLYLLDELSEGQRTIIGLYGVLQWLGDSDAMLLLDEPDNFLALREIQPFLNALSERDHLQRLIISHHPEILNLRAKSNGVRFFRDGGGPARCAPFQVAETPLTASEVIARGWDDAR